MQSASALKVIVSGEAVEKEHDQHMTIKLKADSLMKSSSNVRCPQMSLGGQLDHASNDTWSVELKGNVGEIGRIPMPSPEPAVTTVTRVDVVLLN